MSPTSDSSAELAELHFSHSEVGQALAQSFPKIEKPIRRKFLELIETTSIQPEQAPKA
jgi:hypothetical protein